MRKRQQTARFTQGKAIRAERRSSLVCAPMVSDFTQVLLVADAEFRKLASDVTLKISANHRN